MDFSLKEKKNTLVDDIYPQAIRAGIKKLMRLDDDQIILISRSHVKIVTIE